MRWLLFLPQLSTGATRVRVWRRLQRLGAQSLKGAVWVLPDVAGAKRALTWLRHELSDGGLEGIIGSVQWLEGLDEAALVQQFKDAADARWDALVVELRRGTVVSPARLARQAEEAADADFFTSPRRAGAERLLARVARRKSVPVSKAERFAGRVWVTRKDIHVDRIASAWLIRRFIDPRAKFRFVDLSRYQHRAGELRFDLHGAEFTHEGPRCTFEVLQARFTPNDGALMRLGQLVHDLDFGDARFGHAETAGFGEQLAAIVDAHSTDLARLDRASALLDDLYSLKSRSKR